MVSGRLKRILFFLFAVLAVIGVSKCQIVESTWHRSDNVMERKRSHYSEEFTAAELKDFMRLWPEFNELGMLNGAELWNLEMHPSNILTWKMRMWFAYRHWDLDRFFYVRERLLSCLEEIKARRMAEDIIEVLSERDDDLAMQMIELQQQIIKAQKISDNELLLITSREDEIKELFKQYP